MALNVNLQKSAATLVLNLQKAGLVTPPVVDLAFVLDVSGSFEDEHLDGTTNDLMTRLVPWGMVFDPDKKLDVYTFSNGAQHVADVGPVTDSNYQGFVKKNIINKVPGWNCGTDYSFAIEKVLENFGWAGQKQEVKKAGFFGKMFGKKDEVIPSTVQKKKSLVLFVTDGENSDKDRAIRVLQESESRGDEVYFLFIGVANGGGRFSFLESIGQRFKNTGFYEIKNLKKFVNLDDEALNNELIGQELIEWFKG